MRITKAAVLVNEKKSIAQKVRDDVEPYLRSRGIRISSSRPQIVITIGGDGTILYNKKYYGLPFFAIGSNTSYMCQSTFSNWKRKLSGVLANCVSEKRLLIWSKLGRKAMPLALNEVGVRNPLPRVISVHLAVGKKHYAFRADGLLFCTPSGSPAYCYSCGGRQMKRTSREFQIVAISPFRRSFRPILVKPGTKCTMRFSGQEKLHFFVDGQMFGWACRNSALHVGTSNKAFLFAVMGKRGAAKSTRRK